MDSIQVRKIFLVVFGIIAVAVIVLGIVAKREPPSPPIVQPEGGQPVTREEVPAAVTVPEQDSDVAKNIAKPQTVVPAAPKSESSLRAFSIRIEKDVFSPDTVIVRRGDTVRIDVTSADKDYDIHQPDYGFLQNIPKGQTKPVQFGATAVGQFMFFCQSCGGPYKGPVGYLIVVEK